jgi:cytochrome c-type biogenesis protein CcmH
MSMIDDGAVSDRSNQAREGAALWLAGLLLAVPVVVVFGFAALVSPPGRMFELPPTQTASAPASAGAGASSAMREPATSGPQQPPADVEQMVERLAVRLQKQPDDARGWSTLAHSYYVLGRFAEAAGAYERLLALMPPDADTLADYADALAMAQGRSLAGKPMDLVRQALMLDPANWKALSMAGTEAFQRGDANAAIGFWSRARAVVPAESDNARMLEANLAEARQMSALQAGQQTGRQTGQQGAR